MSFNPEQPPEIFRRDSYSLRWYNELIKQIAGVGEIDWNQIDFTNSDHDDLNGREEVDPTSTNTVRNRHVSNNDLKTLQDQIDAKAALIHTHLISAITDIGLTGSTSGQVLTANGTGGATFQDMTDYALEVSRGNITGVSSVNKFGRCPDNVDSADQSDIWDGAQAAIGTKTWVAPTAARVHSIASSSASDASGGVGARTIQVYGLTSWDTAETSEVITMNGTTGVNTVNSYVIIHRMKVLTKGATDINVGNISATAATDATVTAYILVGQGQTQMAIYGVPSTQTAYVKGYYCSVNRANAGSVDVQFLLNPEPDTELTNFQVKSTVAINSTGSGYLERDFTPYPAFAGPCIIKVAGQGSTNNMDVSAGFDLYLVNN